MPDMIYRQMGKCGLRLSAFSLGSWQTFGQGVDNAASEPVIRAAYEAGINFFDGAESYGPFTAEEALGYAFKKNGWRRDTLVISSKVSVWPSVGDNSPTRYGLSRKHLVEACDQALQRMHLDYLDLYFCHRPDPTTPLEEIVRTMNELIQRGKILYWGTSEFPASDLIEMHRIADRLGLVGPQMEQSRYSLFWRDRMEKELLPIFDCYGMGTTIWSPLEFGLLSGKYNKSVPEGSRGAKDPGMLERMEKDGRLPRTRKLSELAAEAGMTTTQLALAWTLKNPNVSTTILGATSVEQLQENLSALGKVEAIDESLLARIDEILTSPV